MISAREIRFLAERKWDSGRLWSDNNRNIIRYIYKTSSRQDRKINIQFFCQCAGISMGLVWKIGQLDQYRDDLKRRKYGQKIRIRHAIGKDDIQDTYTDMAEYAGQTGKKTTGGKRVNNKAGECFGA